MGALSWCLIGLIVLIALLILGRIIMRIAMWILITILVLIVLGGGVALFFHLLGALGL